MENDLVQPREAVRSPLVFAGTTSDIVRSAEDSCALLTAVEQERANRFISDSDRSDFVAAHILVRRCAAQLLEHPLMPLTIVQRCPQCGGPHGRPTVAEAPSLCVSMAHTHGYVAASAAFEPIGVDVERTGRQTVTPDMMKFCMAPRELAAVQGSPDPERAFLRQWVRKEALVKVGEVTLDAFAKLDLADLPGEPEEPLPFQRTLEWGGWYLLDWFDPLQRVIGAAVARRPPLLTVIT